MVLLLNGIEYIEQSIPMPVDKTKRTMHYSGKKKRHIIVKNQIMVNNRDHILHKTADHRKERKHDYKFRAYPKIIFL